MATVDDIFKLLTDVNKTTLGRIESEIKAMNATTLGRIEGEVKGIGTQVTDINNSIPGIEAAITDIRKAVADLSHANQSLLDMMANTEAMVSDIQKKVTPQIN